MSQVSGPLFFTWTAYHHTYLCYKDSDLRLKNRRIRIYFTFVVKMYVLYSNTVYCTYVVSLIIYETVYLEGKLYIILHCSLAYLINTYLFSYFNQNIFL